MKYFLCIFFLLLLVGVVVAAPPKCILVVKPIDGDAPLTVMASEESGDATIVDWAWDFGDGDRAWKDSKLEHVYDKAGEYKLVVTVINGKGEETSQEQLVVVKEPVTPELTPIPEPTSIPTRIVYQGSTAIRDSLASPFTSKNAYLSTVTTAALKDVKYPYNISTSKVEDTKTVVTTFKVQKYRCDEKMGICGYWIEAYRDGEEVQVNSPIWISPPPYEVVVSEIYDSIAKENVITVKEDPKEAIELILQEYVDRQPLGKPTVGTKE
jgi:PKD repeat protein